MKRTAADDPLLRACPACLASIGKGCSLTGNNDKPITTKATRLVHAARLQEKDNDQ